jgi:hypothetical protein
VRWHVAIASLTLLPAIAAAQPSDGLTAAIRVGAEYNDYGDNVGAAGPLLDGEVGWRASNIVIAAGVAATTAHVHFDDTGVDVDHHYYDLSARLTWFASGGLFAGAGLLEDIDHSSGMDFGGTPVTLVPFHQSTWKTGAELYGGYNLGRIASCGCAPEIFASAGYVPTEDTFRLTARIGVGVRL